MKTLHISVVDKIATYMKRDGDIVCGNTNYQIEFTFDAEWDEHTTKTARFIWKDKFTEVQFDGNICPVPMFNDTLLVTIGVYAGNLQTTTPASIECKRSILCGDKTPSEADQHYISVAQQAAETAAASATAAEDSANKAQQHLANTQLQSANATTKATDAANSATEAKNSAASAENFAKDAAASVETSATIAHDTARAVVSDVQSQIDRNTKRIANVEAAVYGDLATEEVNADVAYVKTAPPAAKPYARVDMIGGMTYRVNIGTEEAPEYVLRSAKVTEIESVGRNMLGGDALADILVSLGEATKDNDAKTVTFASYKMGGKTILENCFKPNTQYTVILYGKNTSASYDTVNMRVKYDDDTVASIWRFPTADVESCFVFTSTAGKTIKNLYGVDQGGNTVLHYEKCGVFEGVLTEADFIPYVKHTLPIPEAVRSKPWYGLGISKEVCNAIRYNEDGSRSGDVKSAFAMFDGSDDEMWEQNNGWGKSVCNYFTIRLEANSLGYGMQKFETSGSWNFNTKATPSNGVCCANRGWFIFYDSNIETLDDWRAHLAENPVDVVYMMATPITEDISDILPADNFIPVQGGGTATAVNEHKDAVPWTITFVTKEGEA